MSRELPMSRELQLFPAREARFDPEMPLRREPASAYPVRSNFRILRYMRTETRLPPTRRGV
jgi:hypothetical protein